MSLSTPSPAWEQVYARLEELLAPGFLESVWADIDVARTGDARQKAADIQRLEIDRDSWRRCADQRESERLDLLTARAADASQIAEKDRTIKSLSFMLGWENVPPRETLERSVAALNSRVAALSAQVADLQEQLEQEKLGAGINNAYGLAAIEVWEKRALTAEAQVEQLTQEKEQALADLRVVTNLHADRCAELAQLRQQGAEKE